MKFISSLVATVLFAGCGPSMEPGGVKSPEDRIREQEQLAYEAEQREKQQGDDYLVEDADVDEREAFDQKQADLELKRASLSARTCGDVVEGDKPKGVADVMVIFQSDGNVREATIGAPYSDTQLGECVLNAYRAVIVPPFRETEFTVPWKLDFDAKPPEEEKAEGKNKDAKASKK